LQGCEAPHSYTGGDLLSTATYNGDGNPTGGTFGGHSSTLTCDDNNERPLS
jgi:hypothetical protein